MLQVALRLLRLINHLHFFLGHLLLLNKGLQPPTEATFTQFQAILIAQPVMNSKFTANRIRAMHLLVVSLQAMPKHPECLVVTYLPQMPKNP